MCGIAGFCGSLNRSVLEHMARKLRHRGPDAEGFYEDSIHNVSFAHRRLSILDITGGEQPMQTSDGELVVIFNGEIYNHADLRRELEADGARFTTDHSDTEVLLHAYRHWGESFVNRLNGMWAFALLDRKRQLLFLSRDRFGKKPLYYFNRNGTLAFASELNALSQHPDAPHELDTISIAKFFAHCLIPAPRSIIRGIEKLPAGHNLIYNCGNKTLRVTRYWEFNIEPETQSCSEQQLNRWVDELRALISDAVRIRLVADVPVGVFLSGGIDSSAIAALAARHLTREQLHTFSIGFQEPSFDESPFAARMATYLGTNHTCKILSIESACSELPTLLQSLDEPQGDPSILPTWLLSRFARQSVTVALGGDGGDELFAGYDPFKALTFAKLYQSFVPRPIHPAIRLLASHLPISHTNLSLDFKLKRALRGMSYQPSLWMPTWMGALELPEINAFLGTRLTLEDLYSEAIQVWDQGSSTNNLVDRVTQYFVRLYLQDGILPKIDRASMLNSLEVRSPFLDLRIAKFASRLPAQAKFARHTTKRILKRALQGIVPDDILHRRKKGFGIPIGEWFKSGKISLLSASTINPTFTQARLHRHISTRSDERQFLWCEYALENWKEGFFRQN